MNIKLHCAFAPEQEVFITYYAPADEPWEVRTLQKFCKGHGDYDGSPFYQGGKTLDEALYKLSLQLDEYYNKITYGNL